MINLQRIYTTTAADGELGKIVRRVDLEPQIDAASPERTITDD